MLKGDLKLKHRGRGPPTTGKKLRELRELAGLTQEVPEQECANLCSYQNSNCRQFFAGSPWPASSYTTVGSRHSCPVCQTTAGEGTPLYAAVYNMHYRVPEYTASAITRDPDGETYDRPDSDLWYRAQLGLCPTDLHEAIEDDCDNDTATWGITGRDDLCPLPSDVTDMLWRYDGCGKCQSLSGDYSGCGYYFNRGHLNPNSINNQQQDVQEGTFSLLNSAPQVRQSVTIATTVTIATQTPSTTSSRTCRREPSACSTQLRR
ncbi:uncharacterized protein [Branchiostoma lanceolatum]|uniref:uncharacterized protein n=1 Tax=Branchiostoma lanceolatum TaxID=7740 RepID=UPI003456A9A4